MYAYITYGFILLCVIAIFIRIFLRLGVRRFKSDISMKGKVVIITGANAGIGYYTAMDLASRGARVILACRNEEKAVLAQKEIIEETGNSNVMYKNLNLSDLNSVRKFAKDINDTEERLDVLINNAGVFEIDDRLTSDGIVESMQVNHFGPFLLTLLLLPLLKKSQPSRIINVSSVMHHLGSFETRKLNETGYYKKIRSYANGKLCNVIFTVELAKRLQGSGVVVNAVHPGIIRTNLLVHSNFINKAIFKIWCWLCCRTAEEGAQTSLYLAVAEENQYVTGKYFFDCKERFTSWSVKNETLARELWKLSTDLVGFEGQFSKKNVLM